MINRKWVNKEELFDILPPSLPYDLDAKIFYHTDDEGNQIGEHYSYNDSIQILKDIAGVSEELLGRYED